MLMAKLSRGDVLHIARLSNLPLNDKEISTFQGQLSEVITYIEQLQEIDIKAVLPTSQTTGLVNIARKDKINSTRILTQESALSEAKKTYNGYFQVPAVIVPPSGVEKQHDD